AFFRRAWPGSGASDPLPACGQSTVCPQASPSRRAVSSGSRDGRPVCNAAIVGQMPPGRDHGVVRWAERMGRHLQSVLILALLAWSTASAHVLSTPETKTLEREQDPVIVRTGLLAGLPDRETSRYRLYAVRNGRLEPVPFQFDARGADGEFILSADGAET